MTQLCPIVTFILIRLAPIIATKLSSSLCKSMNMSDRFAPALPFRPAIGRLAAVLLLAIALIAPLAVPAEAQSRRTPSLPARDAEIEALLNDYTAPIFKAAGLWQGAVDVHILIDERLNAFATSRHIVMNTGMLLKAETPNEVIGVLAHETGHVAGSHLVRLRDRLDRAKGLALLSMLAGAGAAALGGDAASAIGGSIALGGQSAIINDMMAYSRSEETTADNMAFTLLERTGQSTKGMITIFELLGRGDLFSSSRGNSYLRSHPMPRDRIALLRDLATKSSYYDRKDPPQLQLRHDMARAKILAYTNNGGLLRSVFRNDPQGPAARYGLALAIFLGGNTKDALPIIDRLIAEQPNNAYLYEQKGEMLLRAGRSAEAAKQFRKAVRLDKSDSGLLRISLGHAMLESSTNASQTRKAVAELRSGISRDPDMARGYRLLARGHSALGQPHLARAAAAEEALYQGRIKDAKQLARVAQPNLKRGTPDWLRMQDIIDYKPPKKR